MRPAHLHVKASSGKSPILTTPIYFKGDPSMHRDAGVRLSLILSPRRESEKDNGVASELFQVHAKSIHNGLASIHPSPAITYLSTILDCFSVALLLSTEDGCIFTCEISIFQQFDQSGRLSD